MAAIDHATVEEILDGYESTATGVTDELYGMGKFLLNECMERVSHLDSKAVTISGYIGAIIALMVSTFTIWSVSVDQWAIIFVAIACLVGLGGGGMALAATLPQKFNLLSDTDWLETDGFGNPDRLKRYYVSSIHLSIAAHEKANAWKVSKIKNAQYCLAAMVVLLLIVLGNATYRKLLVDGQP